MVTPPPAHDAAAIAENPSAFPMPEVRDQWGSGIAEGQPGMTLRDWFAGQIAAGMAAHSGTMGTPFGPGDIAMRSYEIANAMLSTRASLAQSKGEE